MAFCIGVGDVILVAQLSWKTWQACTSGRKAAPGEFTIVKSELWTLSSTLEDLATLWAADVDARGIPQKISGLEAAVSSCKETIEQFNQFLEKYRPACTSPTEPIKWTVRARNNWRKIMWGTHKDVLDGFRERIDRHVQTLNTLTLMSERYHQ